ncbi:hypothetical protein PUNSTDRAFT_49414 [Punctularia strigosozonata HHB-11173 SS5]|uniref:uncharacterized protein n=1 Tax=Punctularia strigosozonata (strain HHB-11173) TaxID=741275 RepID=UPI000441806E|nr:uncharacterized protein PUNSTDRAFT_49414 [Punctularia strigosozonata HHB-11173 SS5]EIN14732.1 hypothetical protein PUNSTDRAFT_49414 [Punctularia strigosozonata HHB-11173 SS5]
MVDVQRAWSWAYDLKGWKQFCRRYISLNLTWEGHGVALEGVYSTPGGDVNSVDVADNDQVIVTTHAAGGLKVTDAHTDQLLWALSKDYVAPNANCAYSGGYLVIFRRSPPGIEIWRRPSDGASASPHQAVLPGLQPIPEQERCVPDVLGNFRLNPHAFLGFDGTIFVFRVRFRFPYLAAFLAIEGKHGLHIWDVRSGHKKGPLLLPVFDIDLNAQRLVVACQRGLSLINFESSEESNDQWTELSTLHPTDPGLRTPDSRRAAACKLTLPSDSKSAANTLTLAGGKFETMAATRKARATKRSYIFSTLILRPAPPVPASARALVAYQPPVMPTFKSVRISTCGKHLAAYTDEELIYIVWDFERVLHGRATFDEVAFSYDMSACGALLQMEWAPFVTRLVVHAENSVFVLSFDFHRRCAFVRHLDHFASQTSGFFEHFSPAYAGTLAVTSSGIWMRRRTQEIAAALGLEAPDETRTGSGVCFVDFTVALSEQQA